MNGSGELGAALRRWRDRLSPERAGLTSTPRVGERRRAAGLRREELALLAGVSVDYVTRLEQGRSVAPSPPVVAGLARALLLSDAEREHLFLLAGHRPPEDRRTSAVTAGVQRLVDRMEGIAASAYDTAWTLIAWNRLWVALTGDPTELSPRQRNVVWLHFTGQADIITYDRREREEVERALVSDLRAATIRCPDDRELSALVSDLRGISERFADLWDAYVVSVHTMSRKTLYHPLVGPLELECHVLMVPDSDLRLVTHTAAAGSESAAKLKRLYTGLGR